MAEAGQQARSEGSLPSSILQATPRQRRRSSGLSGAPSEFAQGVRPALIEAGAAASLSQERRDLICSVIGLTVKLGLVVMAGVSLVRLAGAYQERMDRQGELAAVLQIEKGKLAQARERFDALFVVDGEQRLIREQYQWIAPNRMRVVWKQVPAEAGEVVATGAGEPSR